MRSLDLPLSHKVPEIHILRRDLHIVGIQHKSIGSMKSLRSIEAENAGYWFEMKRFFLLLTTMPGLCYQITSGQLVGILETLSCGRCI